MTLVTKYEWRAAAEAEGFFGYWQRPLLFFLLHLQASPRQAKTVRTD
jgi:hypothetical protein